jgi:hypothetical protein
MASQEKAYCLQCINIVQFLLFGDIYPVTIMRHHSEEERGILSLPTVWQNGESDLCGRRSHWVLRLECGGDIASSRTIIGVLLQILQAS